jgi:CRISPR/Cas system-associated exonuclease Cas4 (RecB family)
MQKFQPPSSKRTIKQYTTIINEMVENVFDKDGSYKDNIQLYPKQPSSYNCKYCSFKNTEYCNRKKKK